MSGEQDSRRVAGDMAITVGDRTFQTQVATDLQRNGLCLEVSLSSEVGTPSFEIFYSDETHDFTMTSFESGLPLELVEAAIKLAKKRLPPAAS